MSKEDQKLIIEAALFASAEPLSADRLQQLFDGRSRPSIADIKATITELTEDYQDRAVELQRVASGYRFQAKSRFASNLQRLWERKPPRYSRAFLETLALIAYRQPISRGEIEQVRGVAVSTDIMKKLLEREWVKIVGHREVPGKPAIYGTTKDFLDYFNLKKLSDLPPLQELVDFDQIEKQLSEQLPLKPQKETEESMGTVTEEIVTNNHRSIENESTSESKLLQKEE